MKEISKYSRLAAYLEKIFNMLNRDFFDGELDTPVITITPVARAYGHYVLSDIWDVKGMGRREINISAGYLKRPIENVVATLLHESCHMYADTVLHVQDCSRSGTYHNKIFKRIAEERALICTRSDKYGWSDTSSVISDELLQWCIDNDIQEILMNRSEPMGFGVPVMGTGSNGISLTTTKRPSSTRKLMCPCCGNSVRATKHVNIACMDCNEQMIEV